MKLDIIDLLKKSNAEFNGALITTDITNYVNKLIEKACIHSIYEDNELISFIAYYDNDVKKESAFLSMIAVDSMHSGKGYGSKLLNEAIKNLKKKQFSFFELEVLKSNETAIEFYKKHGFQTVKNENGSKYFMKKNLSIC